MLEKKKKEPTITRIKKWIEWNNNPKMYTVELLNIYYNVNNPSKSYIKINNVNLKIEAQDKKDLFKKLKSIHINPILNYSYKTYDGKVVKRKVSTREKIASKYALDIRKNRLPSMEELEEIYSLKRSLQYIDTYEYKAKEYIDFMYDEKTWSEFFDI